MKVTVNGQVTIPRHIREKLGITPYTDVNFQEEGGRVYLTKKETAIPKKNKFRRYRGTATVKMSTDEIMALTRGQERHIFNIKGVRAPGSLHYWISS